MEATAPQRTARKHGRIATAVTSLDALVGAHPEALAGIFAKGEAARPDVLGERPRGRLLTVTATKSVHLMLRPVVAWVSSTAMPWEGLVFDHGGNAGANVLFGRETMRFRAQSAPSALDGEPALVMTYASNPWPVKLLRDELRMVNDRLAIGPTFVDIGGRPTLVAWFGVEAVR